MAKKKNALKDLEKRLARVEHHVGQSVHRAVKKAEADFKAAQRQLAKEERKWARKLRAAVKAAEKSATRGGRDVERLARRGTYATVNALRPAKKKRRARRRRA